MLHLGNYILIISTLTEDKGGKGVFHRLQEGAGLTLNVIYTEASGETKHTFYLHTERKVHPSLFPVRLMLMLHHISNATGTPCSPCVTASKTVSANLCGDTVSHAGAIETIKATRWDPGEDEGRVGVYEKGSVERKAHTGGGKKMRKTGMKKKKQRQKSEDKRGAISVAGFMYCQHYPRY